MSEEDFWQLTPAQFVALINRKNEEEERLNLRAGVIASTIATIFTKKQFKPSDFFRKEERKEKTWQELLTTVEIINAAFGGQDLRKKKDGHG